MLYDYDEDKELPSSLPLYYVFFFPVELQIE